jgi:hypothetical protein
MALKAEVFDSRRNVLGEGPTSSGPKNNHVMWVDIYGKAVRWRDLASGEIGEYQRQKMLDLSFHSLRAASCSAPRMDRMYVISLEIIEKLLVELKPMVI